MRLLTEIIWQIVNDLQIDQNGIIHKENLPQPIDASGPGERQDQIQTVETNK